MLRYATLRSRPLASFTTLHRVYILSNVHCNRRISIRLASSRPLNICTRTPLLPLLLFLPSHSPALLPLISP